MNAERILSYIGWLLADEKEFNVQGALEEVRTGLANLSSSPQEPTYQKYVSDSLIKLNNQLKGLIATYDAVQAKNVSSIGADPFFTEQLIVGIRKSISENALTPTIVYNYVTEISQKRSEYLNFLNSAITSLKALNIKVENLEDDSAEIGFQLPRDLFNNELDGLVNELRAIKRIIRAFSENALGAAEPIEVRQISTSDPIFYFGLGALTISQIGDAVSWALDCWKKIEAIRKIRADTKKLGLFDSSEVKSFFDKKIEETVSMEIESKVASILGAKEEEAVGRKHEQRTDMAWALESLLARIERGMTVEIRFLPPKQTEEASDEDKSKTEIYEKISEINDKLVFPPKEEHPVLALPAVNDQDQDKTNNKQGRKPITT